VLLVQDLLFLKLVTQGRLLALIVTIPRCIADPDPVPLVDVGVARPLPISPGIAAVFAGVHAVFEDVL
jgi:hypothetical protein